MFYLAKYNTQTIIQFPMIKRGVVDFAATADWTPATGDTKVSKDQGNFANSANNPAAVGGTGSVGWSITLSATELSCAELAIQIVDSATKAVEDQFLIVYTYGNASAKIPLDLSINQTGDAYGLLNGAQAEPGQGAPAVNASPMSKLAYLFKAWRNKVTQTSSQYSLFADDAATIDQKATVSDDGTTFTRGEMGSGP